EVLHPLPGGGALAVEPTRALTAIDVDLGDRKGADAKRLTRAANLAAIELAARLLRLKSLGGIVVIDLVGRGHDAKALLAAARLAARCAPPVAKAAGPLAAQLTARIGARFTLDPDPARARENFDVAVT